LVERSDISYTVTHSNRPTYTIKRFFPQGILSFLPYFFYEVKESTGVCRD
jgi:hypothetical protein